MIRFLSVWVGLVAILGARISYAQKAGGAVATTDTSEATLSDSTAHFQVMFLAEPGDTLVFTREREAKLFVPRDTIKAITEADVYDTLDYRNYIPGTPYELIEDRISCLSGQIPLTYNKTVNSFINFFVVRKRNYTQTMLERKDYFFPIFEEALRRYNLPEELKYLSIVESGLNMRAISKSGAVGLWQFMGPTGRDFRLGQDKYIDDRMDPHKATEAACRYLRFLYNQFNDWELALAAYNCGPGSIRRTMSRTGGRTFWEIYNALPQETRSYVPQFTAVVYAMNYAANHNLYADADSMLVVPRHDTIVLDRQVSLTALSHHLQVPAGELVLLNPSLRKPVSPEQLPFTLNLPHEAAVRFREERQCFLDSSRGQPLPDAPVRPRRGHKPGNETLVLEASGKGEVIRRHHTVRRGESLYAIARTFDVTVKELRHMNRHLGKSVKPGQRLVVGLTRRAIALPDSTALAAKARQDSAIHPTAADMPKAMAKEIGRLKRKSDREAAKAKRQAAEADSAAVLAALAQEAGGLANASPKSAKRHPKAERPAEPKAERKGEKQERSGKPAAEESGNKVYEVQTGDTLWSISQRQGTTVKHLMELNGLKDKTLKVGMRLIVG